MGFRQSLALKIIVFLFGCGTTIAKTSTGIEGSVKVTPTNFHVWENSFALKVTRDLITLGSPLDLDRESREGSGHGFRRRTRKARFRGFAVRVAASPVIMGRNMFSLKPVVPGFRGSIQEITELLSIVDLQYFETVVLPEYLQRCRWFGGKTRRLRAVHVADTCFLDGGPTALCFIEVDYLDGEPEYYSLPLMITKNTAATAEPGSHDWKIASCSDTEDLVLCEATGSDAFQAGLFHLFAEATTGTGRGRVEASIDRDDLSWDHCPATRRLLGAEQSNSSVLYGNRLLVKLLRRLRPGINPEVEVGRVLSRQRFRHSARLIGDLEYDSGSDLRCTLAVAQEFVPNRGDAWEFTLRQLEGFYDRVTVAREPTPGHPDPVTSSDPPAPSPRDRKLVGLPLEQGALLGRRTAQLHRALAAETDWPGFLPEPVDNAFRSRFHEAVSGSLAASRADLERLGNGLAPATVDRVRTLIRRWDRLNAPIDQLRESDLSAARIRIHGDFHLGQVLVQDGDFVIIDFEGEPLRPVEERREKKLALTDVAGMLRSFQYAACAALLRRSPPSSASDLMPWARYWANQVSCVYLRAYLEESKGASFLPSSSGETDLLLRCCLIDKALYELRYELNNRPSWVDIPLEGLLGLAA